MVSASHAPLHCIHRRSNYSTPPAASSSTFHALDFGSHVPAHGSHALVGLPVAGVAIFWAFFAPFYYVTWVIVSL
jgi:hypothetical protein